GLARARATPSGREMASSFGTCSPTEICSVVARMKAIATESVTATPCEREPNAGLIRVACEGSIRAPMPIEAIVIPTWQADRYSSISASSESTIEARLLPWEASCSSRDRRDRTSANSAATKTPLTTIRSRSRTRRSALIVARLAQALGRRTARTYFEGGRRRSQATATRLADAMAVFATTPATLGERFDVLRQRAIALGDAAL